MDWKALMLSAILTQVIAYGIKKAGWQPFLQKWGMFYFIIPGAFFLAYTIYLGLVVFNPWGEVQAGLRSY